MAPGDRNKAGNPKGDCCAGGPVPAGGLYPITEDNSKIGMTRNNPQPTLRPKMPSAPKPPFLR